MSVDAAMDNPVKLVASQIQLSSVWQSIPVMRYTFNAASEKVSAEEVLHDKCGYRALSDAGPCLSPVPR